MLENDVAKSLPQQLRGLFVLFIYYNVGNACEINVEVLDSG